MLMKQLILLLFFEVVALVWVIYCCSVLKFKVDMEGEEEVEEVERRGEEWREILYIHNQEQ